MRRLVVVAVLALAGCATPQAPLGTASYPAPATTTASPPVVSAPAPLPLARAVGQTATTVKAAHTRATQHTGGPIPTARVTPAPGSSAPAPSASGSAAPGPVGPPQVNGWALVSYTSAWDAAAHLPSATALVRNDAATTRTTLVTITYVADDGTITGALVGGAKDVPAGATITVALTGMAQPRRPAGRVTFSAGP